MAGSSDAVTEREAMIIEQIEYYFGDFNLSRNNFLKEKIQEDDGWVTIDTMLKFNRIRYITEDSQMICEALKKSSSGLMEVSEQGDKIRRSPSKLLPGDKKRRKHLNIARTVYAKPFPLDAQIHELLGFFQNYGQLQDVVMKRNTQKIFEGTVFVTFANKEDAAKFINQKDLEFQDQPLIAQFVSNYRYHNEFVPQKKKDLEKKVRKLMTRKALLHLKVLNSETSIEQVKVFFSNVLQSDKVWVDIAQGATEGYIRLPERDSAGSTLEKARSLNNGIVVIQDSEVEVRVVEGDEELQYWKRKLMEEGHL